MSAELASSDGLAWRERIEALARKQVEIYTLQPLDLVGHANREKAALEGYRGRQLLELLQNADDANDGVDSGKLVLHLTRTSLVAANTGAAFTERGIESLVISDASPKQLTRNRFIGCKGLGFRSVLTWSRSPRLVSGAIQVQFSHEQAERAIQDLANAQPDLGSCVDRFAKAEGELPVPVMRFPMWADDPAIGELARRYVEGEGCVTAIELPFGPGAKGEAAYAEALMQLRALGPEILLFCRNLTEVQFRGDHIGGWALTRTALDTGRTRIRFGTDGECWVVHRREGRLPADPEDGSGKRRDFELAVAIPEADGVGARGGHLAVFFPTRTTLPIAPRLHATLDITDDRNRLIQNESNRAVLAELAAFFAEVMEQEAAAHGGQRALRLMRGVEAVDADLVELGFMEALVPALGTRKVFPRLCGDVETAAAVRRPPVAVWSDVLTAAHFPEVLDTRGAQADGVLALFDLRWYEPAELVARLRSQLATVDRATAGLCVGKLLRGGAFRQLSPAPFLIDTESRFIGSDATVFLHPSEPGAQLDVPSWATRVRLLAPTFQTALLASSGESSAAMLALQLSILSCDAHEYGAVQVAKAVLACIEGEGADEAERRRRWSEAVRWLYRLPRAEGADLSRLGAYVLTSRGALRHAGELYLSAGYPQGELLRRLYGPFGIDEFVASPAQLGLDGEDVGRVQQFLVALGVSAEPRMVELDYATRRKFVDASIDRQSFPLVVRGAGCTDARAVRARCKQRDCEGVEITDRLPEIAKRGDANALAAYLLANWELLVAAEEAPAGVFLATVENERNLRREPNVRLLNPALWMLRETQWIPCDDGTRRFPREVSLSAEAVRLLEGALWKHALRNDDPLLARYGGAGLNALLMRLGAVPSLDGATDDAIYALLERLPDVDPEGRRAREIYRTLADREPPGGDSPAARRFREGGRVWARRGKTGTYVPVSNARYNANLTLTRAVERELVLIDIPKRRSTANVQAVFGVEPLRRSDVAVSVRSVDPHASSEQADVALRRAIPFLYALRLHRKADEDGRERRLFADLKLVVCKRIYVEVELPNVRREEVLDQPGDSIAHDGALYVVGEYALSGHGATRIWQGVARLLDELLTGEFRAEALLILERGSVPDMEDALRAALLDDADPKLAAAYERLGQIPVEVAPPPEYIVPPVAEQQPATEPEGDRPPEHAGPARSAPEPEHRVPTDLDFRRTEPPERRECQPRRLVIAGRSTERPRTVHVRASQDLTFQVVEHFERVADPPRFTIDVSHIRGKDGFGCDLVSVASEEIRRRVEETGTITDADILRYIEVKGRSQRTGDIELEGHEQTRAEQARERYFVYRVFVDAKNPGQFEVAILSDPMFSNGRKNVVRLDLSAGSGAEWFVLKENDE